MTSFVVSFKLTWNPGHIWSTVIPLAKIASSPGGGDHQSSNKQLEYKFVVKEGPHKVIRWEEGSNHKVDVGEIERKAGIEGFIEMGDSGGGVQDRARIVLAERKVEIEAKWQAN